MNLAILVLQMALQIVSMVNTTPNLPQWQRDQAVSIANQSIQLAQTTLSQSGYNYSNNQNCYAPYQNCGTFVNNQTGTSISVLGIENIDTNFIQNGRSYTILWSPYNTGNGAVTMQLLGNSGTIWIGQVYASSFMWSPSVPQGMYTLQILQNGSVIGSRQITIQ